MDRICVQMPDDPRDFLVAVAVMQDYGVRLAIGSQRKQREESYEVTYRMRDTFQEYESCLQIVRENTPMFDYTGWSATIRGDFDCFIDFNIERAKNLIHKFPDAHATEAFGILVGGGPLGIITGIDIPRWPVLNKLYPDKKLKEKPDIGIIKWQDGEEPGRFFSHLMNNHQGEVGRLDLLHGGLISEVNEYDIIIGPGSYETYAAGALSKAVIEVYKTREEALWYNSQGIAVYNCILGRNVNAGFMWRAWEEVWQRYQEHLSTINKAEQQTTMELPVFTADDVDVRS